MTRAILFQALAIGVWLRAKWCGWTHGGGTIQRDSEGRINWRCDMCGRWSDHPVTPDTERGVISRELLRDMARRGGK